MRHAEHSAACLLYTSWHVHKATKGGGQTLVCVGGRGYYQEWGKETVELHSGDAINIRAGVKLWHGAAPDSWFSHLAIQVPGENNSTEWLEPVGDEEYSTMCIRDSKESMQVISNAEFGGERPLFESHDLRLENVIIRAGESAIKAVSYTHLDVYKRQELTLSYLFLLIHYYI